MMNVDFLQFSGLALIQWGICKKAVAATWERRLPEALAHERRSRPSLDRCDPDSDHP